MQHHIFDIHLAICCSNGGDFLLKRTERKLAIELLGKASITSIGHRLKALEKNVNEYVLHMQHTC